MNKINRREALTVLAASVAAVPVFGEGNNANAFTVIVMDPLASELSCACVKGYAQRNYEKLSAVLSKELGRPVKTAFAASLTDALKKKTDGKADLIIGKESVARLDIEANKLPCVPVASLTGLDGKTTMTGLFVVAALDKAITPADLKDHKILFGNSNSVEKHGAALALLKDLNVTVAAKVETCPTCSDGAVTVLSDFKAGQKTAAVISSYATPILEGCGTVKKGDLRIVGETAEVPFIVAFLNEQLPQVEKDTVKRVLAGVVKDKELATALETKLGFVDPPAKKK